MRCCPGCGCAGGWLYQEADSLAAEDVAFTPVSEAQPTPEQLEDLRFAWRLVKHVKSNAITLAKQGRLLGMGSGQPNRVQSVGIALEKAGPEAQVGVVYWILRLFDECARMRSLLSVMLRACTRGKHVSLQGLKRCEVWPMLHACRMSPGRSCFLLHAHPAALLFVTQKRSI